MKMSESNADMMARFDNMNVAENAAQDEKLPPGARDREEAAVAKAQAVFDAARELIATGMLQAVGYRVVVKPIESVKTLEAAEVEVAPTLAEAGFEVKSEQVRQREEHVENHGVIIHLGPTAFYRLGGESCW